MTEIKLQKIRSDMVMLTEDKIYPIKASKATFYNLGTLPVWVDDIPLPAGGVYQVNIEFPYYFDENFSIRFDSSAAPVSNTVRDELRLTDGARLLIQTFTPNCL